MVHVDPRRNVRYIDHQRGLELGPQKLSRNIPDNEIIPICGTQIVASCQLRGSQIVYRVTKLGCPFAPLICDLGQVADEVDTGELLPRREPASSIAICGDHYAPQKPNAGDCQRCKHSAGSCGPARHNPPLCKPCREQYDKRDLNGGRPAREQDDCVQEQSQSISTNCQRWQRTSPGV